MATRLLAHRLSIADDWVEMAPTTDDALRDANFIDGRTDIWSGEPQRRRLSDFLVAEEEAAPPSRFVFHLGFCGSTFLTRLLTRKGHALVLREPKCLADVAKQQAAAESVGTEIPDVGPVLEALKRHLARPWTPGEAVVVKPTNYINNMLMELLRGSPVRSLFLTCSRDRYVPILFNGGGYRLFLAHKAAQRFAASDSRMGELLTAAIGHDDHPLRRLARLAAAAHEIQMRLFRSAAVAFGFPETSWLDAADLRRDPLAAAQRAAVALDLEFPESVLAENAAYWAGRNAKVPEASFSPEAEQKAIASSFEEADDSIAAALDWANAEFGREPA